MNYNDAKKYIDVLNGIIYEDFISKNIHPFSTNDYNIKLTFAYIDNEIVVYSSVFAFDIILDDIKTLRYLKKYLYKEFPLFVITFKGCLMRFAFGKIKVTI